MREKALGALAEVYIDALKLSYETRRAIESFTGPIPDDSPYRYLRMSVGDAITSFLRRSGKPITLKDLAQELQDGQCIFGVIKSPFEIVSKTARGYIESKHLIWMNKAKTLVGLPEWKKK